MPLLPAKAQDKKQTRRDSAHYKTELSVNVSSVFSQIFSGPDSTGISPYMFDVADYFSNKYFARLGFGGTVDNQTEKVEGFADEIKKRHWRADLRLGFGRRDALSKKILVDYGIDFTAGLSANNATTDSGFDVIESIDQKYYIGGGPFFGFSYKVHKRLSIRSETAFYLIGGRSETATLYKNFPALSDFSRYNTFLESKYYLPTNLFVQYSF